MADRAVTGVLLVGGASRRFGSPKALASFRGTTLAEHVWALLGDACDERLAFGKAGDELPLPFPVRDDGLDVRAPIAGVIAGLRTAQTDICVFMPVDCPLMTAAALRALADACADAAVPPTGPLPASYAKSALPTLERRLDAGDLALRGALAELEAVTVTLDCSLLVNVNAPGELAAL
jgi:molybdopterin-guanine dinucleotide biosynthesis protein A